MAARQCSLHLLGIFMKSKLITISSFVRMSFLCDIEMKPTKMYDEDALRFLMQLDIGKLHLSSLIDNNWLNSVYQEVPVVKLLNAFVATHLKDGNYGLVVSVDDYEFIEAEKIELKLPWVYHAESLAVASLKTNFCDIKLLKSPEGATFTFKGYAPTFTSCIMRDEN